MACSATIRVSLAFCSCWGEEGPATDFSYCGMQWENLHSSQKFAYFVPPPPPSQGKPWTARTVQDYLAKIK